MKNFFKRLINIFLAKFITKYFTKPKKKFVDKITSLSQLYPTDNLRSIDPPGKIAFFMATLGQNREKTKNNKT